MNLEGRKIESRVRYDQGKNRRRKEEEEEDAELFSSRHVISSPLHHRRH